MPVGPLGDTDYTCLGPNTSATWLNPEEWALVHSDILSQCDTIDGVADGIIEDPDLCWYRPVTLQCAANATNTSACLSAAKVQTVTKVFQPYYGWGADNQTALVFPRMQPGSELSDAFIYYNGQPFPYTEDWMRYAILEDPNWQARLVGLRVPVGRPLLTTSSDNLQPIECILRCSLC